MHPGKWAHGCVTAGALSTPRMAESSDGELNIYLWLKYMLFLLFCSFLP